MEGIELAKRRLVSQTNAISNSDTDRPFTALTEFCLKIPIFNIIARFPCAAVHIPPLPLSPRKLTY